MSITIMNLLMAVGIVLTVIATVVVIKFWLDDKRMWHDIELKASSSGIKGFDD